jgi:hypothetical protein
MRELHADSVLEQSHIVTGALQPMMQDNHMRGTVLPTATRLEIRHIDTVTIGIDIDAIVTINIVIIVAAAAAATAAVIECIFI